MKPSASASTAARSAATSGLARSSSATTAVGAGHERQPSRPRVRRVSAETRRCAGALTIEAYVERYLDDYRERQKDSAYVTASSCLAPFRREFGHLPLA